MDTYFYKELLDIFVKRNEGVHIDKEIMREYSALTEDQEYLAIALYRSQMTNKKYITDKEVERIGTMYLDFPPNSTGLNRKVQIFMKFGTSEVQVRAVAVGYENQEVRASIEYQSNIFNYDGKIRVQSSKPKAKPLHL